MEALLKQIEEYHVHSGASVLSILDILGEGLRIIDTGFRIIFENKPHRELLGSHIGEFCFKAYQKKDSVCDKCSVALSFHDGKIRRDIRTVPTDSGPRFIEVAVSTLKDPAGRVIAGIEIVRDITDRKKIEEEREKLIHELQDALQKIKTLKGLIPVCAWCKKARNDQGYWDNLENYVREHSDADFTHGICPECLKKEEAELEE